MAKIIGILLCIFLTGCMTKVEVTYTPVENLVYVNYEYPFWQEKYLYLIRGKDFVEVKFESKSDPLVKALDTVDKLSTRVAP